MIAISMEQQAEIRNFLTSHNIMYYIKVFNMFSKGPFNNRVGSLKIDMDTAFQYKFYAHKDDFEQAKAVRTGTYK